MTVWEALAATRLPPAEAELLLRTVTGWPAAEAIARRAEPLPAPAHRALERLARARAAQVPLQHLTGRQEFFGVPLAASDEALIPRPDTETLVEAALERLTGPAPVIDVGCGGGAIAVALAEARPEARVLAVEPAPRALRLARENLRARGLDQRVLLVAADLLTAALPGCCQLVVANLPYLPDGEPVAPEVGDHEPASALRGGPDGLEPLRRLAPLAARTLRPGGALIAEIGAGQAQPAAAVVRSAGLGAVTIRPDLAGIPRVVVAER